MGKNIFLKIFDILVKSNSNAATELLANSKFEFLVAVILSSNTMDKRVNCITNKLFAVANSPQKILDLGEKNIQEIILPLGMYRIKAKYLIATSKALLLRHSGKVPNNRTDLENLPGIGRKSANVILNYLYKKPVIAVDTHVLRVCTRLRICDRNTRPQKLELLLYSIVPSKYHLIISDVIILHGRYICKARNPMCDYCPLGKYCCFYLNTEI